MVYHHVTLLLFCMFWWARAQEEGLWEQWARPSSSLPQDRSLKQVAGPKQWKNFTYFVLSAAGHHGHNTFTWFWRALALIIDYKHLKKCTTISRFQTLTHKPRRAAARHGPWSAPSVRLSGTGQPGCSQTLHGEQLLVSSPGAACLPLSFRK